MKKIDINVTMQTIANVGVVVGIIFLAMEIRQNSDAVRSATVQDISRWSYDATLLQLDHPEIMSAREAACSGSMTNAQRATLDIYYSALLRIQISRFQQAKLGILDEALALDLGGRSGAYRNPYFIQNWPGYRERFDPDFVQFMEREYISSPQDGCLRGR